MTKLAFTHSSPSSPPTSTVPLTLVSPSSEDDPLVGRYLQTAQRERMAAMARLSEDLAHELNNPLHTIACFASLARRPAITSQKLEHYLDEISRSVVRCNEVIQALRECARHPGPDLSAILEIERGSR